jgi:hypothetical protein
MHTAIEARFAASLLKSDLPVPVGIAARGEVPAERRFAVYRNNVVAGLVRALESRFPVVERLVGEEFFRAMAQVFVTEDPPRSPILFRYGSTFPDFIEGFSAAASVPYLADVARLELARGRAYHAADAAPLPAEVFAGLGADELAVTGVRLHPSAQLMTSPHPIVSIWRSHQDGGAPHVESWQPEAALVLRPAIEVEVHRLPSGGYSFLTALAQGASLARAATIAAAESPDFNPVQNLAFLIETRAAAKLISARPM